MIKLLAITSLLFSFNLIAAETYDCNFSSSHFNLVFNDNQSISLENKFQKFPCTRGSENFPGTELELKTLVCKGRFKDVTYYMANLNEETIILTRNVVLAKDVTCKKIN